MSGGFAVTPAELEGAAGTLGGVQAEFACPGTGAGDLGSPELEAAVQDFNASAGRLAQAMGQAVQAASVNVALAASLYTATDLGVMPQLGGFPRGP
jgi:hypothetical protein